MFNIEKIHSYIENKDIYPSYKKCLNKDFGRVRIKENFGYLEAPLHGRLAGTTIVIARYKIEFTYDHWPSWHANHFLAYEWYWSGMTLLAWPMFTCKSTSANDITPISVGPVPCTCFVPNYFQFIKWRRLPWPVSFLLRIAHLGHFWVEIYMIIFYHNPLTYYSFYVLGSGRFMFLTFHSPDWQCLQVNEWCPVIIKMSEWWSRKMSAVVLLGFGWLGCTLASIIAIWLPCLICHSVSGGPRNDHPWNVWRSQSVWWYFFPSHSWLVGLFDRAIAKFVDKFDFFGKPNVVALRWLGFSSSCRSISSALKVRKIFSVVVTGLASLVFVIESFVGSGQVWEHTSEQNVATSTLRRCSQGIRLAIAHADARSIISMSFR